MKFEDHNQAPKEKESPEVVSPPKTLASKKKVESQKGSPAATILRQYSGLSSTSKDHGKPSLPVVAEEGDNSVTTMTVAQRQARLLELASKTNVPDMKVGKSNRSPSEGREKSDVVSPPGGVKAGDRTLASLTDQANSQPNSVKKVGSGNL